MKPVKTQYKGIIFDSKSEAVFARCLDLVGLEWKYHPGIHCGHEWDFLVDLKVRTLVEYKPSQPTHSYVHNLTKKMGVEPKESIVVWGNPWSGNGGVYKESCYVCYPIFCTYSSYGWGDFNWYLDSGIESFSYRHPSVDMLGITNKIADLAKGYRFDLC